MNSNELEGRRWSGRRASKPLPQPWQVVPLLERVSAIALELDSSGFVPVALLTITTYHALDIRQRVRIRTRNVQAEPGSYTVGQGVTEDGLKGGAGPDWPSPPQAGDRRQGSIPCPSPARRR